MNSNATPITSGAAANLPARRETVLVFGATGNQGGAVVDALLDGDTKEGLKVRAMVRNPETKKAKALAARGVELVKGDMLNKSDVQNATKGVSSIFLVTVEYTFKPGGTSYNSSNKFTSSLQADQANYVLQAAKSEGVKHIVFSSGLGVAYLEKKYGGIENYAKSKTKSHVFLDKMIVEDMVRKSGLTYTIIRPAGFFEMIVTHAYGIQKHGEYPSIWKKDIPFAYIACRDIGRTAAKALLSPAKWDGKEMGIASQILTSDEIAKAIANVRNESDQWKASYTPRFILKLFARPIARMVEEYERMPEAEDVNWESVIRETKKALDADVMDIKAFLLSQDVDIKPYPKPSMWCVCA